jgi:serine/threonine-protein kinase HipA
MSRFSVARQHEKTKSIVFVENYGNGIWLSKRRGYASENFSIIYRDDLIGLSPAPAYDLLNTTIALPHPEEELALPLNGKKNRLTRQDLVDYFGRNRLQLTNRVTDKVMLELKEARPFWEQLLAVSFLSEQMKEKYLSVLEDRFSRLYG